MTDETIFVLSSTINAVVSAATSVADGAFNATAAVASVLSADTNDNPFLKLELRMTFSGTGALTTGAAVHGYFRKDGIGGATKAPNPDADYKHDYVGSFKVDKNNSSTEQILTLEGVANPIGEDFEIWVENDSGKNSAVGWDMDVVPYTYTRAP